MVVTELLGVRRGRALASRSFRAAGRRRRWRRCRTRTWTRHTTRHHSRDCVDLQTFSTPTHTSLTSLTTHTTTPNSQLTPHHSRTVLIICHGCCWLNVGKLFRRFLIRLCPDVMTYMKDSVYRIIGLVQPLIIEKKSWYS